MADFTATIRGTTFAGSLADLSRAYSRLRDASGEGASTWTAAIVRDAKNYAVGHIGYNGRIWSGFPHEWNGDLTPIYDNRVDAEPADKFAAMDSKALNDWYEEFVGYRPQVEEPRMTDEELRDLIRSYIDAADHAMAG